VIVSKHTKPQYFKCNNGGVAQSVRALPCHGRGRGFESRHSRHCFSLFMTNYWILKSEPETYSWDRMYSDVVTKWDGVRNYQARNFMKSMNIGDLAFFYHSGKQKQIVGIVSVVKEYYPDSTESDFGNVDVQYYGNLILPVTLTVLKNDPVTQNIMMIKQSRLSVSPIASVEYQHILRLSGM
jgi:predicted RNA-binding protein with PUA-like domain